MIKGFTRLKLYDQGRWLVVHGPPGRTRSLDLGDDGNLQTSMVINTPA
jgi:hypothetical protein